MYRTIDASFWTDPKVRKLGTNGRFLFLYLITNPHTHVSGLYYLPALIAQYETGLAAKPLRAGMDTLSSFDFCRFDHENELVWVVRMFRFQGSGLKNTLSAAHHISKDIHNSFLINEFLETYPEVKPHVKNRVSRGYPVGATPDSPLPTPEHRTQNTEKGDSRRLKNAATRPRDAASDFFAEKCLEFTATPHDPSSGDFVMLSKLRKAFGTAAREMPPGWEEAVANYFASPLAQYSLADLANPKRYAVFRNSPLDQYNKPVRHGGNNGHESRSLSIQRQINQQHQAVEQALDRTADGGRTGHEPGAPPALLGKPE